MKGFSPVWIRIWFCISLLFRIILLQNGQPNIDGPRCNGSFCNNKVKFQEIGFIENLNYKSFKIIHNVSINVMPSAHMWFKRRFQITFVITKFTKKWLFSCMNSYMTYHFRSFLLNFRTIWTSKLKWTKLYWLILQ